MTWIWTIPLEMKPMNLVRPPLFNLNRVRAVVPTFRDWEEARMTLESLLSCNPRPAELVLVNDNTEPGVPTWTRRLPITCLDYPGNRGPAHARNFGAQFESGRPIDWFYFTDTACLRDSKFFAELVDASMEMPRTTVAIAAPVIGIIDPESASDINRYMTEEAILNPPFDKQGPQAIITANAAVSTAAFSILGGFNTEYPLAAGEDLDLGVRLRGIGSIGWADRAVVRHRFEESPDDFYRRFFRYGSGNAQLERTLQLPSLRVESVRARDPVLQHLADKQVRAMQIGYDQHMSNRCDHKAPLGS